MNSAALLDELCLALQTGLDPLWEALLVLSICVLSNERNGFLKILSQNCSVRNWTPNLWISRRVIEILRMDRKNFTIVNKKIQRQLNRLTDHRSFDAHSAGSFQVSQKIHGFQAPFSLPSNCGSSQELSNEWELLTKGVCPDSPFPELGSISTAKSGFSQIASKKMRRLQVD